MQRNNDFQTGDKPLYLGHRARLRAAFFADEGMSMPDYELLELLLTFSIPRRDVKPLAKQLIAKFGDLNKVVTAPIEELLAFKGISKNSATLIKMVEVCQQNLGSSHFSSPDEKNFSLWSNFISYCTKKITGISAKELLVFFFDDSLILLGEEYFNISNYETEINLQNLIYKIIFLNATQIVLAHRDVNANKKPSANDILITEKICKAVLPLEVKVIDYLIFSDNDFISMAKAGVLPSYQISKILKHK